MSDLYFKKKQFKNVGMKSLLYSSICITTHNMLCISLYKKILCSYHNHLEFPQSNIMIMLCNFINSKY